MVFLRNRELAVREEESGGPVSKEVELGPGETPVGKSSVVLLVHGYCNDLDDARESYSTFITNCLAARGVGQKRAADMFRFYWPGDKSWGFARFASYPLEIEHAIKSAEVLERFLRDLPQLVDLYLIAHSLGNRVVLELLRRFIDGGFPPHIQLKGICMMAAAVPVSFVRWPGGLHYAAVATNTHVLYSPGDMVLQWFSIGELFDARTVRAEAVGLHGEPFLQWRSTKDMTYGEKKKYGHGDYWKQEETTVPVASFLDSPAATSLLMNRPRLRTLPPPNELLRRTLAKYRTPIRLAY
jgi:hypothetical protein